MTNTRPPSLIAPYIKVLQELERGVGAPRTALQMHFVEVCRGGLCRRPRMSGLTWRGVLRNNSA